MRGYRFRKSRAVVALVSRRPDPELEFAVVLQNRCSGKIQNRLLDWTFCTGAVKPDVLTAYLNVPWFIGRSLIALFGWSALALLLRRVLVVLLVHGRCLLSTFAGASRYGWCCRGNDPLLGPVANRILA